jgi:ATP-dependent DNA ligase
MSTALALQPPLYPMEAKSVDEIPEGPEWQYEPKWDGFRCLAFRDGSNVELQSKAGQPLTRYFPELVSALLALKAKHFVLDGEIVVFSKTKLSFDNLLQRIHPADSRVKKLAQETPARLVLFDLLANDRGRSVMEQPLSERRGLLEAFAAKYIKDDSTFLLSPATERIGVAREWLTSMRGQLDGVVAKRLDLPYLPGERAMQKIKNLKSADCVVGGFRYLAAKPVVGSLLLGLYDDDGLLQHVGFTSSIPLASRAELTKRLRQLIEPPGFTGKAPGGPSRWSAGKSTEWEPLRPELVVEVRYDHFSGDRFRHGTKFLRWRPDKAPEQCKFDQVEAAGASPLKLIRATS